jgi:uncharacterized delta-60 repeat protein
VSDRPYHSLDSLKGRKMLAPRVFTVCAALGAAAVLAGALPAARGDLDPTFGSGGKVTTDFGGSESAEAVAVQRDKRVVVAGGRLDRGPSDFVLARYTASGKLDSSFDGDGKVETDFAGRHDWASDVEVQVDGKIVAAGSSSQGGGRDIALARYNRNGSLDPTFSEGGKVLTTFQPSNIAGASAVLLQPDGKIVAGGHAGGRFASAFALARYLPDGVLDPSFGSGGRVSTAIPGRDNDRVFALAAQADRKVVAAGGSFEGPSDVVLARYNEDGSLDPSFGGDGIVVASFRPVDMVPLDVFVRRDGRLLAGGYGGVTRFATDGSLDRSFGDGGRADSGDVSGSSVTIQPDGKILVTGTVLTGGVPPGDFGVARLTADGRLDTTYGRGGSVVTGFSRGSDDQALDGVLQPNGRLVVSGITNPKPQPGAFGPFDFAVARYVAVVFCVVPDVRGKTLKVAKAKLSGAQCRLGKVRRAYSPRVRKGRVISQRPGPRARLAERAKVDLLISRGRRR